MSGNIDLQAFSGVVSVTLMSGPMFSTLEPNPVSRRRAFLAILSAALLLALGSASANALQAKSHNREARHEIDRLEDVWRNAILKGDAATLTGLLAEDYTAISSSGTLQTKDDALSNIRNHRIRFTSLDLSERKVRFYGNTALVTSLAQVQGTTPDGEVTGSYRYTRVYVRNPQGQWKIVSFEASRIRQPGGRRKLDSDVGSR